MPKFRPVQAALVLCLASPALAQGQAHPMVTDRPDFTESPFVVPLGSVQIEAGLTWQSDGRATMLSWPEALVRWSPVVGLEARLEPPGHVGGGADAGRTDAGIGIKVEIGRIDEWSVGAIASVGLPVGDEATSAGGLEPGFVLTAGRGLGPDWSLGTQASVVRPARGGGVTIGSTLVAGRTLTPDVGAFLEVAAERQARTATSALAHAGLTLSISPTLQLDVHAARRLDGAAPDWAVGVGVSTRFD